MRRSCRISQPFYQDNFVYYCSDGTTATRNDLGRNTRRRTDSSSGENNNGSHRGRGISSIRGRGSSSTLLKILRN